jgi:SnoaL-like domain
MKTAAASVVVLCVALSPAPIADRAGDRGAVEDDSAAIMEVVERQAAAFWAKDFARWSETWVHADYVRRVGWSPTGGVISVEGWDAIGGAMKKLMAENPTPNPTPAKLVRDHINVRSYKDVAWVTFDQHGVDTGEARFDMPGLSHETRILERHDGKWRLAYVGYVLADKPSGR